MSDITASDLTQAIDDASVYGSDQWQYDIDSIIAVARLLADNPSVLEALQAGGKPLRKNHWWCTEHESLFGVIGLPCDFARYRRAEGVNMKSCMSVPAVVITGSGE